jgi:hypothetical protein
MGSLKLNRRVLLSEAGVGLGGIALASLLGQEARAGALSPKRPHQRPRAKSVIFLLMEGGPSHLDTFDPKPKLRDIHMTEFVRERSQFVSQMESGKRYYVASPFDFSPAGQLGIPVCEHLPELATCVDDLCFYRGAVAESVNHPTALYHLNTGNQFGTDPALGAWCAYGLGTPNEDLPAFVVLPDTAYPQGGPANWSNGFLPPQYQGTPFRPNGSPILDLAPPAGVTPGLQRRNLDLLQELNRAHVGRHPEHPDLAARMETYELAFRMQAAVPGIVDIESEPARTKERYGIGNPETDEFARRCLLARRLVEQGVRFVQVYSTGWDSHDDIATAHRNRMRSIDRPIAALIKDLKQRGMLDDTLVVWGGEFGRSADNGVRRNSKVWGRDHNPGAMTFWFAGGGVKAGAIIGATDETGQKAVEVVHPLRDVHVTLLHLLGLDDNRLRFFHAGRNKQLSQVGGRVIEELLA